jgi:hypothetical protein
MFGGERQSERTSSTEMHTLRFAVLDLSQRALAGYSHEPSLIEDHQPLNDKGLPGITHETRAINLGARQEGLGLPAMKVIRRLSHDAYALAASQPIDFDNSSLTPYKLDEVDRIVEDTIARLDMPRIDRKNAFQLREVLSIPQVRKLIG